MPHFFTLHLHIRSGRADGVKKNCKGLVNVNFGSGSGSLIVGVTDRIEQTLGAARLAGLAERAAVVDDLV